MGYSQSGLLGAIYDMALGVGSWDNILDLMRASLPGCAIIVSGDDMMERTNLVYAQRGLRPSSNGPYVNSYASLNPWSDALSGMPTLHVVSDEQLVPREVSQASRFVTEWLAPQGDYTGFTAVVLLRAGTRQLTLQVHYPADAAAEVRQKAAEVLAGAAEHLGRAMEICSRGRFSSARGYLDDVVEALPFPVLFVDQDMRIHYANYHAETLRRQDTDLFHTADGFLRAVDPEMDERLQAMVHKAVASRRSPSSVLQIGWSDADVRYLAVARLASRSGQVFRLHDAILDPGPLVMLVMQTSVERAVLPTELLWGAFSLTKSESALAEALLSGITLGDYAKDRKVSKQTLRNQLVGVMRKTGTRRQSELVSLLTRLSLVCF